MSESAQPPPLPPPDGPKVIVEQSPGHPTFFKASRGIWLFTWKSQLTWRRLPMTLLNLLALPVLIYITTLSPASYARFSPWVPNPALQLDSLENLLDRSGSRLRPEQRAELLRAFAEEYARGEKDWREHQASGTKAGRQREHIQAAHERSRSRAQAVLDERQFPVFDAFERQTRKTSLNQVRQVPWSRVDPFYRWLIDFYFFMILPLWCVRACGALIRDELQADTLGFLTTRPLTRARLVILKYLSQTAWLQLLILVNTLLVFAAAGLRQVPALGTLLPLFLAAQFLAILAWSALGIFLGQLTTRYMPLAIVYGLIVEMGLGRIPTNINTLSLMRHLKALLAHNPELQGMYAWNDVAVLLPVGAVVLATGLFLTLAALLFTFREYHHTVEIQN